MEAVSFQGGRERWRFIIDHAGGRWEGGKAKETAFWGEDGGFHHEKDVNSKPSMIVPFVCGVKAYCWNKGPMQ